ncbi:MAG: DHA2 family efflux MFS transporter permease subunit [Pseudomonadota bacterium]
MAARDGLARSGSACAADAGRRLSTDAPSAARTWLGFLAMCLAMFMAILDIQVVASSLTTIGHALHVDADQLSWIQTAYLMAEVIAIPLTGWLTRALSLRWLFVAATAGFTLASFACALSTNIEALIAIRVVQGFFGGMLIPAVFTSVFTHMPEKHRVLATTLAGVFAVLAPTVGPTVGGYLTQTFSWHWIFLVNVAPGCIVVALVALCVRRDGADLSLLRRIDYAGIALTSLFLASLELMLKEAPKHHWQGPWVLWLAPACALTFGLALARMNTAAEPYLHLRWFKNASFSVGCALSFVLGAGLYGSVYTLAIFLGLVREHGALAIGLIMLVSGAAQLLTAPVAAVLETRIAPRLLVAAGYGVFALGLWINSYSTPQSDYDALFWPQAVRGAAVMFCLLPATRIALDIWPKEDVAEASGLFNLMRNLGGAIGIAMIDTILLQQAPVHASEIVARLEAHDVSAARELGLPMQAFLNHDGPITAMERMFVQPLLEKAALAHAFNDAWRALAVTVGASLVLLAFVRKPAVTRGTPAPH